MTAPHSGPRYYSSAQAKQSGTGRYSTGRSSVLTPASWLLVAVALVLIGVLTYYLTLTTRPEISSLNPTPNSLQNPGVVDLEAHVTSPRTIEEATFLVDGDEVPATLEQVEDGRWRIQYQQIFERGEREVLLRVTDSSGRTAEHAWSFEASGDLIEPRMILMSPPSDAIVAPGLNGVAIQTTTFGDIENVELAFDGEPVRTDIEEIDTGTEYSNQDDMPIFDWLVRATYRLEAGSTQVEATVTDEFGATASAEWTIRVSPSESLANAQYFDLTGEYITEPFLSYFEENDGSTTIGPPVGPAFAEEGGELRQYFRYARLELDSDGNVYRGLIGREVFGEPENPPDRAPGSGARQFDATGHYIVGTIRGFWEDNGGLGTFGYPLSQEFETDNGYAQYFERALIEVTVLGSYEIVDLSRLGEQLYAEYLAEANVSPDED
jgi:hypothetical protein